ncbi:MAG: hypothetical protein NCW75_00130 [Phycisphaera sp.]|nr:MAG: hypothetical protein NCW75_00130 [Phycisphaera sp.]
MTTPRSTISLCCLAAIALASPAASAQCPPVRFVSPDGAEAREFGGPLAMSPAGEDVRVAIGQDGSVWAFDLVDGRLTGGQELTSPFTVFNYGFGWSVDVQGDRMAIGAYQVRWPDRHYRIGSAAVYDRVGDAWQFTGVCRPPEGVTTEGAASRPLIDGDTIIGAGGHRGSIVVFRPAPGTDDGWTPIQVIDQPKGIAADAWFGHDIAAKDGWLFVGAFNEDILPTSGGAGSVSVYRRQDSGTYDFVQKIDGPDMGPYDIRSFGRAIGFDGTTLAVSAFRVFPGSEYQGFVHILELEDGLWTLRQALAHRPAKDGHHFGTYAVEVDGDRLVAQVWGDRTPRSDHIAVAFERTDDGVWRQNARLLPTPPFHAAQYAGYLALLGDLVLVGSSEECEGPGTPATGAAYLFNLSCYECPDLDNDDVLTVFDYLEFLRAFDAGEAIADFDNDGQLTVADFLAFQDAFAVGCP